MLRLKGKDGVKKGIKMDRPLGEVDEGSDHELSTPRDAFLVDSDDELDDSDEDTVDSPDGLRSVAHDGYFTVPMKGLQEYSDRKHWRRYVTKKRTYGESGKTRFFVKPPPKLYSMTLEDLDEYDAARRSAENQGRDSDAEEEESESDEGA